MKVPIEFDTERLVEHKSVVQCAMVVFLFLSALDDVKIRAGSKMILNNINSRTFQEIVS